MQHKIYTSEDTQTQKETVKRARRHRERRKDREGARGQIAPGNVCMASDETINAIFKSYSIYEVAMFSLN